jgi:hypothetical protein
MIIRWVESDYHLWKIRFVGTLYQDGARDSRLVFVIAESAEEAISAIKNIHDESAGVTAIKQVGTCIYGEES